MYNSLVSRYFEMMRKLLADPSCNFTEVYLRDVPEKAGVYAIYDKKVKAIIYVGRTRNVRRRLLGDHKRGNVKGSQFRRALKQNFALKSENEITNYILENCSFQFLAIDESEEMVRLEHFITAVLAPILNIQLKQ